MLGGQYEHIFFWDLSGVKCFNVCFCFGAKVRA